MSHLWTKTDWKKYINTNTPYYRDGLRFRFEKGIDPELRQFCLDFGKWLRKSYYFPLRVPVYFKASEFIVAKDKDLVYGTFWEPTERCWEPYIRVSTGDYCSNAMKKGKFNASAYIIVTVAHELTHYFQWINGLEQSLQVEEWQASYYANRIVCQYFDEMDLP